MGEGGGSGWKLMKLRVHLRPLLLEKFAKEFRYIF